MGEKATHAPLVRIAVARIVAQPDSVVTDRTASVSSFAQHFMVLGELFIFSFQPAETA